MRNYAIPDRYNNIFLVSLFCFVFYPYIGLILTFSITKSYSSHPWDMKFNEVRLFDS